METVSGSKTLDGDQSTRIDQTTKFDKVSRSITRGLLKKDKSKGHYLRIVVIRIVV